MSEATDIYLPLDTRLHLGPLLLGLSSRAHRHDRGRWNARLGAEAQSAVRDSERADEELIAENPLLAYVPPLQYAAIAEAHHFPLPAGFER